MFGFKPYNYDTFTRGMLVQDMATDRVGGPEPGERAPDFEARTLDGDKVRLSDYRGHKNVVLTFGSATCPMTAASIGGMNDLYEEYNGDGAQFLLVYVREAHPGEELPAHESMDDKVHAAETLRDEEDVNMPVLVDDLRGSIHKKYGKLPNSTYIIDRSGRVAFRCLWTQPPVVKQALEELLERQQDRGVDHVVVAGGEHTTMPKLYPILHAHRALERGGDKALYDFRNSMGVPGRAALMAGRVARPVAEHPMRALTAALLTGGVVAASVLAGRELRRRRMRSYLPYDVHEAASERKRTATGTDDYEPVGI